MIRDLRFLVLPPALALAACSGSGGNSSPPPSGTADVVAGSRIRSGEQGDDDSDKIEAKFGSHSPYMTDSKGKPMGESKLATEFQRSNSEFQGGFKGKQFNAGEYRKKSWWGDRDYAKKVYGGDTEAGDLVKRSRFEGSDAREGSANSRDDGRRYPTGRYGTGAAREASGSRLAKTSDAETDIRRDVFTDPDVMPYQQQNGMTLDEVKQRLGR